MGTIKQFTLRFDMGRAAEAGAMEYLKTQSEYLGVSKNTFLLQLIQKEMNNQVSLAESESAIKKIIAGVLDGLSAKGMAVSLMPVRDAVPEISGQNEAGSGGQAEILSDDAMDFLSCF